MKICWDGLKHIKLNKNGYLSKKGRTIVQCNACSVCGDPYITYKYKFSKFCCRSCSLIGENHPQYGKKFSKEWKTKLSAAAKIRFGDNNNNPNYKGGVERRSIPLFDTFARQLDYVEDTKPVAEDGFRKLAVRCAYCGKWFVPTILSVRHRIAALKQDPAGRTCGEGRFYCSENCKTSCPTYRQRKYPKGFKHATSREVNPHLRQMVFERDNWSCQKCDNTIEEIELHCHHMDPVAQNPMFQNDMDSCISLCKGCHKETHLQHGCRYVDLRCKGGI